MHKSEHIQRIFLIFKKVYIRKSPIILSRFKYCRINWKPRKSDIKGTWPMLTSKNTQLDKIAMRQTNTISYFTFRYVIKIQELFFLIISSL